MAHRSATLIHVVILRGGTYHDGATVHQHHAATGFVDDSAFTTFICTSLCEQSFRARLRTKRELWLLRLRRFMWAVVSIAVGAGVAIAGGSTGVTPIMIVAFTFCLIAYVTGLVFFCRIFAGSARYILTRADGGKVSSTEHKLKLGASTAN